MRLGLTYNRRGFSVLVLIVLIAAVTYIIIQKQIINNFYITPPETFLQKILPIVIGAIISGIFLLLSVFVGSWITQKRKAKKK